VVCGQGKSDFSKRKLSPFFISGPIMNAMILLMTLIPFFAWSKNFVPTSFTANYEENLVSVTGKAKKSFGKVDYKYPGHLRFEVTSPVASLFVVNPKKTWFYQPAFVQGEKDQVTIQKTSNLPLIKFLDSVKDGIESSKLFSTKFEKNDLILSFNSSAQKEMGFEEVILHAKTEAREIKELKGFENITLKHTNKNKTNIRLIDLKENVSFPAEHFEFRPSPNTKVINN
jgi:outer membrane lipoprotein-sorting protein